MQRKSSRGNPWHDARGRFCHGPEAKTDTWGNPISDEQRSEAVLSSEQSDEYYKAKTLHRNGLISEAELEQIKDSNSTHPKQIPFTPAQTRKEAEEFTRSLGVTPYFKGLDLDTCNAINESVAYTLETFPETREYLRVCGNAQEINRAKKAALKDAIVSKLYERHGGYYPKSHFENYARSQASRGVGRVDASTMAHTFMEKDTGVLADTVNSYMGIYVNSAYKNGFNEAQQRNEKTGYHPKGCTTTKSVIDHECGHLIHAAYGGLTVQMRDSSIKDELSEYAQKNVKEYHAEAWSEYINNPRPRRRAVEVANEFFRRVGEK